MKKKDTSLWYVYMVRCKDNSLYTGITLDIKRRFEEHNSQGPQCAKYLRGRGPLKLVYTRTVASKPEALRLEYGLKNLPKSEKERLVRMGEQEILSQSV